VHVVITYSEYVLLDTVIIIPIDERRHMSRRRKRYYCDLIDKGGGRTKGDDLDIKTLHSISEFACARHIKAWEAIDNAKKDSWAYYYKVGQRDAFEVIIGFISEIMNREIGT
jgi:hypothetical protein